MIGVLIVFALSLAVISWYWKRRSLFQKREQMGIPGPDYSFWLGNLKDFNVPDEEKNKVTSNWFKEYGDTFGMFIGPQLKIFTKDTDILKEVLIKKFNCFTDRMHFALQQEDTITGEGVVNLRGEKWKNVRNGITPVFSSGKIKQMSAIVQEKEELLMRKINGYAESGEIFNIHNAFQALTLDVIGQAAFAIQTNCQLNPQDPFLLKCIEFFANTDMGKSKLVMLAVMFPELSWLWSKFRSSAPFGAAENWLIDGLKRVFDDRKLNYEKFKGIDVLQIMLRAREDSSKYQSLHPDEDESSVVTRKSNPVMTDNMILGNSFVFLLAGYETTSTALGFTAFLLAKHPEKQKLLQDEIREYLSKNNIDTITYDMLRDLPYLDGVFHESLRFYPPVPGFVQRKCTEECTIKGYNFEPGADVAVPIMQLHFDPQFWTDPQEFMPERFVDNKDYNPMTWVPFGAGPRNCIGLRFAEMEYKLALAKVMSRFTLQLPSGAEKLEISNTGVLLRPKKGVMVRAVKA